MASAASPLDLVDRLIRAIEAGDLAAVRSVYAPDVIVWGGFDDRERDVDSSLGVLEWLLSVTTSRRYDIVRRIEIDGGVLQQHVLHATTHAGKTFSMPACLVIRVERGLITRVDEYLDPAPVTAAVT
ncbi:MAG TPA: nuclear transport factor 2 family protein [Acidimicrobiia bacterium]|jgi:ketosteroid isomerase-like protein